MGEAEEGRWPVSVHVLREILAELAQEGLVRRTALLNAHPLDSF